MITNMEKEKTILLVKWVDSASSSCWQPLEDVDYTPIICTSVGFLIHEDDNSITLALNYGSNPQQVSNITTIPKCSIKECVEYGKED